MAANESGAKPGKHGRGIMLQMTRCTRKNDGNWTVFNMKENVRRNFWWQTRTVDTGVTVVDVADVIVNGSSLLDHVCHGQLINRHDALVHGLAFETILSEVSYRVYREVFLATASEKRH